MDITFWNISKRRIICITALIMESLPAVVGGVVGGVGAAVVGCAVVAFVAGFWRWGDPLQNIFPSRAGFGAGAVNLHVYQGFGGVKADQGAGAYTYGVRQRVALFGEAVGLPGQSEGCGGGAVGGVCGVKRGEDSRGGVSHGFSPCQQRVDNDSLDAYRLPSSGLGLSLSSPFALWLGPRSDSGGIPSRFPAVSFSGSVLVSSVR